MTTIKLSGNMVSVPLKQAPTLGYEEFRERITTLVADYERLSVQDYQQWNAAEVSNAIDTLLVAYPEHHDRYAAEICTAAWEGDRV